MNELMNNGRKGVTESNGIIQIVSFILRFALGLFISVLFVVVFFVPFWILGVKNLSSKWNKFMDSVVFNQ
jgi:hypothetical protein